MTPTQTDKSLAAQVVLPMADLSEISGRCPAWVESRGTRCAKPAQQGFLCSRHHGVATRRLQARREQVAAEAAQAQARTAEARPTLEAELAVVENRLAQLDRAEDDSILDAPTSANTTPQLHKRKTAHLERAAARGREWDRLTRRAAELRQRLGQEETA